MDSDRIYLVGFVDKAHERSVTVTIKRGTSKLDVAFLLTKMLEAIYEEDTILKSEKTNIEFRTSGSIKAFQQS